MNAKPTLSQKPLPKWFDGQIYNEGGEVTNPYTDQSMKLTAEELSMYDFIKGAEFVMSGFSTNTKLISQMRRGLDWFRRANPEAYMVLLD
jgi:hypothetical protein